MAYQAEELELDDIEIKEEDLSKLKLKFDQDKQKVRIGFPLLGKTGKVAIKRVRYFPFSEKYRKQFLITGDEEFDKEIEKYMGAPKDKYVTAVVHYQTDMNGKLIKNGGLSYVIRPFVIPQNKLPVLQSSSAEFPLNEHDYILTCTNKQFQNFDLSPTKDAIWLKNDKIKAQIMAEVQEMNEAGLHQAVAIEASKEKIKEWLEIGKEPDPEPEAVPEPTGGSIDLDDDDDISDLLED